MEPAGSSSPLKACAAPLERPLSQTLHWRSKSSCPFSKEGSFVWYSMRVWKFKKVLFAQWWVTFEISQLWIRWPAFGSTTMFRENFRRAAMIMDPCPQSFDQVRSITNSRIRVFQYGVIVCCESQPGTAVTGDCDDSISDISRKPAEFTDGWRTDAAVPTKHFGASCQN